MVGRALGAEEHLATELVDALQAPLVVVELGLFAQVQRIETDVS